jgi:hypothetical protein
MDKLRLKKFKMVDIVPNATILLCGRRRSGKSYLTRDIFYNHRDIPMGLIFSGTEDANPFYSDFIPDTFIHSKYDPQLVESVLNSQSKKIREARKTPQGKDTNGCVPNNRFFLVLDDMLQDAAEWKRDSTIKTIFYNGRHFNVFFILAMQYPYGITPDLRSNIDYVFLFNEPSGKNRKRLYEDYGSMIPSYDYFCNILDSCTQNHECLVLKLSGTSSDLRDQVFWYKAKPHDDFRVGHPKIWKYHDQHYNTKHIDEKDKDHEEIEQLKKKFANTRKLKVIVSREDGDIVDYKEVTDE